MEDKTNLASDAFHTFMKEAPNHAKAWVTMNQSLADASALDKKTESLIYLAVFSAIGVESGISFYVVTAKENGASREEVISAILVALPVVGNVVYRSLPMAIQTYDRPH